jgi:hypothetical protein
MAAAAAPAPGQGIPRAEHGQRLLDLQELGKARSLAAVGQRWIRIRQPGALLAADHVELRAKCPSTRAIPDDEVNEVAFGSILGRGQRWRDETNPGHPGTHLGPGRHEIVLEARQTKTRRRRVRLRFG